MRVSMAVFLLLLASPVTAADVSREVPEQFLGRWCTEPLPHEEDTGESDISIGRSEIGYYQSAGKILAAAAVGYELALIVELTEAGGARLATHEFELSDNGDKLTSMRSDGQVRIRGRCGESSATPAGNPS